MRRTYAIYFAAACVLAPLAWALLTVEIEGKKNGYFLLAGSLLTVFVVLGGMVKSHREGRFAPNRCATCDSAMRRIQPGELRPPVGRKDSKLPTWRCQRCGRLV